MIKTVKEFKSGEERTLLSGLILHTRFLGRIVSQLAADEQPFRSRWSNLVAGWCFAHFREYQRAPRRAIQHAFRRFAAGSRDEESVETIGSLLEGLSEEYKLKEFNEQYLVDLASRYFRQVRLERTVEELEASLEREDLAAAESVLSSYSSLSFGAGDWINPTNPAVVLRALQEQEDRSLLHFRGDLDRFLAPHFERDGFISFVGPEKRGKSFWLLEVAWQGMIQRRRVLYYVVGDMSQSQVMRRLVTRALHRPLRPGTVEWPKKIKKAGNVVRVITETKDFSDPISLSAAVRAMKALLAKTGTRQSRLKLRCCGGGELSASDVERDVRTFCRQGWIPDLVVLDYADLLAPETLSRTWDFRHQINESWKILRRIASDHHLLLITGTQAAATSYNSTVIRKSDFSEDKRKNAHVTGMLGINQTQEEKREGLYRLNWVFLRDGAWTDSQVVWTAGSLALACPCMVSTL